MAEIKDFLSRISQRDIGEVSIFFQNLFQNSKQYQIYKIKECILSLQSLSCFSLCDTTSTILDSTIGPPNLNEVPTHLYKLYKYIRYPKRGRGVGRVGNPNVELGQCRRKHNNSNLLIRTDVIQNYKCFCTPIRKK